MFSGPAFPVREEGSWVRRGLSQDWPESRHVDSPAAPCFLKVHDEFLGL